jgi:hypothetical protein
MGRTVLRFTCISLFSALAIYAQAVSGTLSGRVTSAGGTGIPSAAVTVIGIDTNLSHKVLTGGDGSFSVSGLPPGMYRVDVETSGYKHTPQQNVELTTTGPTSISIIPEQGNVNETVELKGTTPAVQGESGEFAIGLGTRTLRDLPVIDRNPQQLVGLQSGITPPQTIYDPLRDPARNRFFGTNGQSPLVNEWKTEGVVNMEPYRGLAVRVQPAEAIQQMNIVTANPREELGYSGGAIVNNITRGGTNGWHGSLFEFHSDNELRSRGYFNPANNPIPKFTYNQFGGTVGGAIVPDRTFFFGSYEGTYQRGAATQLITLPTQQALLGNFTGIPGLIVYNPSSGNASGAGRVALPGAVIPRNLRNPTAAAIAGYFPAPNQPGLVNNYASNVPFLNDANKFDGRIDQHFTDRTSAFVRYGYSNLLDHEGSILGNVIGAATGSRVVGQNAVVDLAHEFGPRLVSDFRVGYNRYGQKLGFLGSQAALGNALGVPDLANSLIGMNISGLPAIGAPADVPMRGVDNTFNWVWNWSLHTSMHNVKWGVDIRRIRSDGFNNPLFGPNGTAFFGPGATLLAGAPLSANGQLYNSWAAFLMGAPTQIGISNTFVTPTIRQTQSAIWIGDTVQLMNRLTADVGVRYQVYSPLEPGKPGGAQFFNPADNTFSYAGLGLTGMHATRYDLDNIAPRVGLALRVTDKTVVRGGYAINYFQMPYLYSGFTAPTFGAVSGVQGGYTVAPFQGQFGPTVSATIAPPATLQNGASAGNLPVSLAARDMETSYVQSYSLQVQREFYGGTVLSAGYVGTLGRHLPYHYELNAAAPGTGVAGLPFAGLGRTASTTYYANGLTNNYNSLQASLTKRFSQGLSFLASYTWSRALGYTTANGALLNPFDLRANYGPLDYDRQHVLTISHLWELPFGRHGSNLVSTLLGGWQLNGIFTWQTGTPLTITADPITCACPGNTVLANLNGAPIFGSGTNYLTPAGFSAPRAGQFGNLGRGALRGPDTWNYDMSLFKSFRVRDRFNVELRGEAYNLTNTPHYANPVTNVSSPQFGQITSMTNGSFGRQLNVGARILF